MMRNSRNNFQQIIKSIKYTLSTIWKLSPKYMISKLSVTIIKGIIPALLTYVGAVILEQLTNIGTGRAFLVCVLLIFVDYLFGIIDNGGLDAIYGPYSAYAGRILGRRLSAIGEQKVMETELRYFYDDKYNIDKSISNVSSISVFFEAMINTLQETITLIGILLLILSIEPIFITFIVIFAFPSFLASNKLAERKKRLKEEYNSTSRLTSHLHSLLYGTADAESKIFGSKPFFIELWKEKRSKLIHRNFIIWVKDALFSISVTVLSNIGGILCLAIIAFKCINGSSDIADVAIAMTIMNKVQSAISQTSMRYNILVSNLTDMDIFMRFIHSEEYKQIGGNRKIEGALKEIRLENVSFSYKNDGIFAIRNIDMTIENGEYTAFVGRNGSGKTTLIKLICGLYTPTEGTIYYNGIPHTEVDKEDLFQHFSILYQDFGKYSLSLKDNILFGSEENRERISAVADYTGVNKIAEEINGYDTMLDEVFDGGVNLSHGQWQRIASARAFYKKADVLMMDEPSSAIDPLTEKSIYQALEEYEESEFRFLVSHRMSYMKGTSRIIMLEEGRISEDGTFDELKKNEGAFKKLYDIQAMRYLDSAEGGYEDEKE